MILWLKSNPQFLVKPGKSVQDDQAEADDAVAAEGGEHALEVSPVDVGLQLEAHDREMADVIREEGWNYNKIASLSFITDKNFEP